MSALALPDSPTPGRIDLTQGEGGLSVVSSVGRPQNGLRIRMLHHVLTQPVVLIGTESANVSGPANDRWL